MLHIVRSNRIETLADHLLERRQNHPPADPFEARPVVVQNKGSQQWLTLRMAQQNGIAAQLEYQFPAGFVYEIYKIYFLEAMGLDVMPDPLPSDKEVMSWSIMRLLKEQPEAFEQLTAFINRGEEADPVLRRWQMSRTLADLLDKYLIYRPDMISRWERGKVGNGEEEQARLWQQLVQFWKQNESTRNLPHRAGLHDLTIKSLTTNNYPTQQLPNEIPVFNLSAQPPIYWDLITRLAVHTDVWIYEQRPCKGADWAKIEEETDEVLQHRNLLNYLGGPGKTNARLLEDMIDKNQLRQKQLVKVEEFYQQPDTPGLIGSIQQNLLDPSTPSKAEIPEEDLHVQLHSCHSPRRELEVLYDRLIDLFERQPDLKPSDIAVVTPNIDRYAPLVEAVFGVPDAGQPALPYHLVGGGSGGQVAEALLTLLRLLESRFRVTEVMDWIDREAVREPFNFSADDMDTLQHWLEQARVRWGVDADDRKSEEQPAEKLFTWQFGLDRLMLGYAMRPDDLQRFADRFPLEGIEGSESTELLGRFYSLMQQLFEARSWARSEHSVEAWADKLKEWIEQFLGSDHTANSRQQLIEAAQTLKERADIAGFDEKVPLGLVRRWMHKRLESGSAGGSVLSGRITFASMVPMRSLPHKVIAVLGLNDADFPREDPAGTLDLIARNPKPGDRSRREEDHYLFLENLLSARRHLIFSYLGRSDRDDSERPPSVILDEFLNYVERQFDYKLEPVKHRLQPFSKKYFNGKGQLFTYSRQQEAIRRSIDGGGVDAYRWAEVQIENDEEDNEVLNVDDLVRFWQHPTKYFAENRLELQLRETELFSEDRDLFALSGLDQYRADQELLDGVLKRHQSLESLKAALKYRGLLPAGWPGDRAFRAEAAQVEQFLNELDVYVGEDGFLDPVPVELKLDQIELKGQMEQLAKSYQVFFRLGKLRAKDKVEAWIWHLVQLVEDNSAGTTVLLGWDKKKGQVNSVKLDRIQDAPGLLQNLVAGYQEGLRHPLPFAPETAFEFVKKAKGDSDDEDVLKSALSSAWEPSKYNYGAEGDDLYFQRAWGDTLFTKHSGPFTQWARTFWQPFFEAVNDD